MQHTARIALAALALSLVAASAHAEIADPVPTATPGAAPEGTAPAPTAGRRLGAYAELDLGLMIALRQSAGVAAGATWGPFRAGLSYATFLSNASFGGVPDGFSMRVNYLLGLNAAYFIGQSTDKGLYIQGMFHIKQQGVTNDENGARRNLNSLAAGFELGYVWKVYQGLYVAPRVGALYYVKKPQPGNDPVDVGGRDYDNDRHHSFDTYYIPTISVGYAW